MADHKQTQAAIDKQIDQYEKRVAAGESLSAADVSAWMKLCSIKGYDRPLSEPGVFIPPPVDGGEDDDDRVIKFH